MSSQQKNIGVERKLKAHRNAPLTKKTGTRQFDGDIGRRRGSWELRSNGAVSFRLKNSTIVIEK